MSFTLCKSALATLLRYILFENRYIKGIKLKVITMTYQDLGSFGYKYSYRIYNCDSSLHIICSCQGRLSTQLYHHNQPSGV